MAALDWIILSGTLLFIVGFGVWRTRGSRDVEDYVRGGKRAKWLTVGLSVMATQASAITFLSTPGQAFHDGMGFVQFYFGLPLAMIIICMVFVPIYHHLKVYTAYEFLEKRFDLKTRTLAALLFLAGQGQVRLVAEFHQGLGQLAQTVAVRPPDDARVPGRGIDLHGVDARLLLHVAANQPGAGGATDAFGLQQKLTALVGKLGAPEGFTRIAALPGLDLPVDVLAGLARQFLAELVVAAQPGPENQLRDRLAAVAAEMAAPAQDLGGRIQRRVGDAFRVELDDGGVAWSTLFRARAPVATESAPPPNGDAPPPSEGGEDVPPLP